MSPVWRPTVAADEAHPRRDRDERHPEGRRQLQHGARQEADAQRRHRRRPIALADRGQRRELVVGPAECAQGGQAPHDVEEVRREPPQRLPPLPRSLLGVAADEPHEDGDQRQRDQHDQSRLPVDHGDGGDDDERDHRGEHDLGQVPGEVPLQSLDALDRDRRELGSARSVGGDRLRSQALLAPPPAAARRGRSRRRGARRSPSPRRARRAPRTPPPAAPARPRDAVAGRRETRAPRSAPARRPGARP